MYNFKIGDLVRVSDEGSEFHNQVGCIADFMHDDDGVILRFVRMMDEEGYFFMNCEIEPVEIATRETSEVCDPMRAALKVFADEYQRIIDSYNEFECEKYNVPFPPDNRKFGGKLTYGDLRRAWELCK